MYRVRSSAVERRPGVDGPVTTVQVDGPVTAVQVDGPVSTGRVDGDATAGSDDSTFVYLERRPPGGPSPTENTDRPI